MKTCKKCGACVKDTAAFCTECGAKLDGEIQRNQDNQKKEETLAKVKKMMQNKKMVIMAAVAVVAIIAVISFAINAKNTVRISDFYEVEFSGGNKFGTADVHIDHDELEYAVCEKLGCSLDSMKGWEISEMLYSDTIRTSVTPNEKLKNGDVIEVKVEVANEKMIDGIKITGFKDKVKVEGLVDYKEITDKELFDEIEVVYTGYSPFLEVQVMNNSKDAFVKTVKYTVEDSGNIKNGDTITIQASWDEANADNAQCYVSGEGKKEIKVEDQGKYLLNKDELTDDLLEQLKQKLVENFKTDYSKEVFKELKGITLADCTNGIHEKNALYALMEVEPDEYGGNNWYHVSYFDVTIVDGEINLGKGWSNPLFNFNDDSSDYDEEVLDAKASCRAVYDLLSE